MTAYSPIAHRGPIPASIFDFKPEAVIAEIPNRQMVDSAYPLVPQHASDIILIYAGGDTPHPWTTAEILSMHARYRWPCWVRSNPERVNAGVDAALFAAWLHGHRVPIGTCVILDLETAVNTAYVNVFNLALRAAGYKVTKYGSQDFIWQNPKTDGGTFVALPGPNVLSTEGDTVARQYAFDGSFDLSVVKPQNVLPLWDTQPAPLLPKGPAMTPMPGRVSAKYGLGGAYPDAQGFLHQNFIGTDGSLWQWVQAKDGTWTQHHIGGVITWV